MNEIQQILQSVGELYVENELLKAHLAQSRELADATLKNLEAVCSELADVKAELAGKADGNDYVPLAEYALLEKRAYELGKELAAEREKNAALTAQVQELEALLPEVVFDGGVYSIKSLLNIPILPRIFTYQQRKKEAVGE